MESVLDSIPSDSKALDGGRGYHFQWCFAIFLVVSDWLTGVRSQVELERMEDVRRVVKTAGTTTVTLYQVKYKHVEQVPKAGDSGIPKLIANGVNYWSQFGAVPALEFVQGAYTTVLASDLFSKVAQASLYGISDSYWKSCLGHVERILAAEDLLGPPVAADQVTSRVTNELKKRWSAAHPDGETMPSSWVSSVLGPGRYWSKHEEQRQWAEQLMRSLRFTPKGTLAELLAEARDLAQKGAEMQLGRDLPKIAGLVVVMSVYEALVECHHDEPQPVSSGFLTKIVEDLGDDLFNVGAASKLAAFAQTSPEAGEVVASCFGTLSAGEARVLWNHVFKSHGNVPQIHRALRNRLLILACERVNSDDVDAWEVCEHVLSTLHHKHSLLKRHNPVGCLYPGNGSSPGYRFFN